MSTVVKPPREPRQFRRWWVLARRRARREYLEHRLEHDNRELAAWDAYQAARSRVEALLEKAVEEATLMQELADGLFPPTLAPLVVVQIERALRGTQSMKVGPDREAVS